MLRFRLHGTRLDRLDESEPLECYAVNDGMSASEIRKRIRDTWKAIGKPSKVRVEIKSERLRFAG
jgi:hypothetical protein